MNITIFTLTLCAHSERITEKHKKFLSQTNNKCIKIYNSICFSYLATNRDWFMQLVLNLSPI